MVTRDLANTYRVRAYITLDILERLGSLRFHDRGRYLGDLFISDDELLIDLYERAVKNIPAVLADFDIEMG